MHDPVRHDLERLVEGQNSAHPRDEQHQSVPDHLAACGRCATELDEMRKQAEQLRSLKSFEHVEPDAGFYARVLQRIESEESHSVWSLLAESPFGKRLAYVSFSLALIFGGYVAAQEARESQEAHAFRAIASKGVWHYENSRLRYDNPVIGNQEQQRAAVLVHFAEHRGVPQ